VTKLLGQGGAVLLMLVVVPVVVKYPLLETNLPWNLLTLVTSLHTNI
jgi:hypothetical protein